MLRGNGGQRVFAGKADRDVFYRLLAEGVERYGHKVCAFCLMNNHVHLAIKVEKVPLSKILQNVAFRYTRWFNRKTSRVGHLFQGRYKAVLVNINSQLLELVRYVHLNPVRAKLVKDLADWPWSGHQAYLGKEELAWLDTRFVLRLFGGDEAAARRRYERFVLDGMSEGRREDFHSGGEDPRVAGDPTGLSEFQEARRQERSKAPTLEEIIRTVCQEMGVPARDLEQAGQGRSVSDARAVVALLAATSGAGTLTQVGRTFDRDVATMSSAVRRLRGRASTSEELRNKILAVGKKLKIERLQA
jgi:REP element-mobilizing transposase RayT